MAGSLEFYFDFISPYAYLGSQKIDDLAAKNGRSVKWRPLLTGVTVLNIMGLKGVAETPLKGPYAQHDIPRFARYLNIPFNRPEGILKPLAPARAFVWLDARDPDAAAAFARSFFRAQWGEAQNLSVPEAVAGFAATLGHDKNAVLKAIGDEAVKEALKQRVSAAVSAGVFGVPTVAVDEELFWGVDRFSMVDDWLTRGGW